MAVGVWAHFFLYYDFDCLFVPHRAPTSLCKHVVGTAFNIVPAFLPQSLALGTAAADSLLTLPPPLAPLMLILLASSSSTEFARIASSFL